jgi:hypothetical protein
MAHAGTAVGDLASRSTQHGLLVIESCCCHCTAGSQIVCLGLIVGGLNSLDIVLQAALSCK